MQKNPEQAAKIQKPDAELVRQWFAIPAQFQSPEDSGLTAVIDAAVTTHDLALK